MRVAGRVLVLGLLTLVMVGAASAQQTYNFGWGDSEFASFAGNGDSHMGNIIETSKRIKVTSVDTFDKFDGSSNTLKIYAISNGSEIASTGSNGETYQFSNAVLEKNKRYLIALDDEDFVRADPRNQNDPPESFQLLDWECGHTGNSVTSCSSNGRDYVFVWHSLTVQEANTPPQFSSTSISPDPPLIGETATFSYDASDPDGNISSVSLTLKDDGSTVFTGSKSTATGTFSPPDTLTEGDINASFEATDNKGATTTQTLTRTLTDTKPVVNISSPSGTVFDYDQNISVDTDDDADNNANESLSCVLDLDSSQIDQRTVTEGDSYTVNTRADLGSHSASVKCTEQDDSQNDTGSTSFTVENFAFDSVSGSSSAFETTQEQFVSTHDLGDMVENVTFSLFYNGSFRSSEVVQFSKKTFGATEDLLHTVNLVRNDGATRNYRIQADVNYQNVGTGTSTDQVNSSVETQTVKQAYVYNQSFLADGFTQLEASVLDFTARIEDKTGKDKAELSAVSRLSQTGTEKSLIQDGLNFSSSFDTDLVSSNPASPTLETNVTVSFNGETRKIQNTDTVTLEKIQLSKDSSTGPKALEFESQDEVNDSAQPSTLNAGLRVFNPDQPDKKRFFGFEFSGSSTHSLHLSPSDAEVRVNSFQKESIEYLNESKNYPKRRHYLIDTLLNNETAKINLYMLKEKDARNVEFELLDSSLEPLKEHVVRIERAFPSENSSKTVAMIRTGVEGKSSTFVDPDEQYIFTVFNQEGELVDQIGPQTISGLSQTLEVEDQLDPGLASFVSQVRFSQIQRGNQSLSVDYVSQTQRLNNIFLRVQRDGLFDTRVLDVDSSEQPQGRLEVTGFNASEEKVFFELVGTFGESNFTLASGSFGQETTDYGRGGVFMSMLMVMSLALAGLFRPSAAIGLSVMGVFVLGFVGFLPLSQSALISVAVLGGLLVWRMTG